MTDKEHDGTSEATSQSEPAAVGGTGDKRRNRVELIAAFIIGAAALFTALATYFGGQISGEVDEQHNSSLTLTLFANDAYNEAIAQQAIERDWIFSWITEWQNETDAALYLEDAMPEAIFALADEWANADDDVADPFSEEAKASYPSHAGLLSVALGVDGLLADEAAECATFEAQVLGEFGGKYDVASVFFAITLVVAGIAALLKGRAAQNIVLVTAVLSLILGLAVFAFSGDKQDARAEVATEFFALGDEFGQTVAPAEALAFALEQCPA